MIYTEKNIKESYLLYYLQQSPLNNAIATGELAKSVVNLGVAIKDIIVGKGVKQATRSRGA